MTQIPVARLKELLTYDPITGRLFWRVDRGKCKAGREITCLNGAGYIVARIDNVLLRAHRIAWAMHYEEWPDGEIDHIDCVKTNNSIANLRIATRHENMHNLRQLSTNKSGKKGVSWHDASQKWQAHIKADGRNYYLGLFLTADEAHEAYAQAAAKLHGVFARSH